MLDSRTAGELLRERGCRSTPQRVLIMQLLEQSRGRHLSVDEIHSQLRSRLPYLDVSTVYRTLDLLCDLGFVRETDLGEGRILYEWADDPDHHHLVCRSCGHVVHVDGSFLDQLWDALTHRYGFHVERGYLTGFGSCANCRDRREAPPNDPPLGGSP